MNSATEQIRRYCADGDQAAFRAFYRATAPKLWKFLVARGCHPDAAYDLLAEAFLRFIQTVCRDPAAPVALLYRIALNLRIDAYRRGQAAPVETVENLEELPVAAPEEPDEFAYLRALIKTLSEREQNLLLLRYWIGLSHQEVAQTLDLPEGTVRRQCAEALQKLRMRWDREGAGNAAG